MEIDWDNALIFWGWFKSFQFIIFQYFPTYELSLMSLHDWGLSNSAYAQGVSYFIYMCKLANKNKVWLIHNLNNLRITGPDSYA